jgi:hypothetical protein
MDCDDVKRLTLMGSLTLLLRNFDVRLFLRQP